MIVGRTHGVSAITFGKAKEGLTEAYNFSLVQSVTSTHSINERKKKSNSNTLIKSLAKSVLSINTGTSNITADDTEDDMDVSKDDDSSKESDNNTKAAGTEVAIKGMGLLAGEPGKQEEAASKEDKDLVMEAQDMSQDKKFSNVVGANLSSRMEKVLDE